MRIVSMTRDKGHCSSNAKLILLIQIRDIAIDASLLRQTQTNQKLRLHLLPDVSVSFLSISLHCLVSFIATANQRLLSASNQETSFLACRIVTVLLLKIDSRALDTDEMSKVWTAARRRATMISFDITSRSV